jgi:ABC-type antimicrobial peptide transport system permease subunit
MSMMAFGFRNAARSIPRLVAVTLLVGAAFLLLLVMHAIGRAVDAYTEALQRSVDATLQIRAAGSMGHVNMVAQSDILAPDALGKVKAIPHVERIETYLLAMTPTEGHNFAMIVGFNPGETKRLESHGEAGTGKIIAGRDLIEADRGRRVAVIGQGYARWAGIRPEKLPAELTLDLGRTHPVIFALERAPATLSIVGIYASGYVFGDMQLFMPLDTFREIYGVPEGLSWLYVKADSAANVPAVERAIRAALGDQADLIAPTAVAEFQSTTTRAVLRLSAAGIALCALLAAVIVYFVMLLIVRQRTWEIGTLKAIGGPNGSIAAAILAEALAYGLAGSALGLVLFLGAGAPLAKRFFGLAAGPFLPAQYKDTLLEVLSVSAGLDPGQLALVVALLGLVSLAGSAHGLAHIVRLSPLQAMKQE